MIRKTRNKVPCWDTNKILMYSCLKLQLHQCDFYRDSINTVFLCLSVIKTFIQKKPRFLRLRFLEISSSEVLSSFFCIWRPNAH